MAKRAFFWVNSAHKYAPKLAKNASLALAGAGILSHTAMVGLPLFGAGVLKLTAKKCGVQGAFSYADKKIDKIAHGWIAKNNWLIDRLLPKVSWDIRLPDDIAQDKSYLLICNHQSWVDTSVIQYVSQDKLPLTRFFAKHELLYIPIVGQAFYLLDFPMMKRHSKEAIAKNPALKGQDLAIAKKACQMLAKKPFVLLNYLEGTRFSPQKHAAQNSNYRHLLKPKAGGLALAIASLGDKIDGILDMTIVYPDGVPSYDGLWRGELRRLSVDICKQPMPQTLFEALKQGAYHDSTHLEHIYAKEGLHDWLDKIWQQKDQKIEALKSAVHS